MFELYMLIPLIDAFLVGFFFWSILKLVKSRLFKKLHSEQFHNEIEPFLDQRLDDLIASLKVEIPISSMLLSGPFVEKLKGQARGKILKMVPGLTDSIEGSRDVRHNSWLFVAVGAFFGFILGVLHLVLFHLA